MIASGARSEIKLRSPHTISCEPFEGLFGELNSTRQYAKTLYSCLHSEVHFTTRECPFIFRYELNFRRTFPLNREPRYDSPREWRLRGDNSRVGTEVCICIWSVYLGSISPNRTATPETELIWALFCLPHWRNLYKLKRL